jgi:NAD(P)-dependent dehydrogenase (short-subunit alcohol dehydrogenase family)
VLDLRGAAHDRQSGHCRFTVPGIGSHGSVLIAREVAWSSHSCLWFMGHRVTRRREPEQEARETRRQASVLKREGTGWDVGGAVRFLLSDQARYITG